jgi:signal transduction histidine kinase
MNLDRHLIWILATTASYVALAVPIIRAGRRRPTDVLLDVYVLLSLFWGWSGGLSTWTDIGKPWSTAAHIGLVYGLIALPSVLGALTTTFLRREYSTVWIWVVSGGVLVLTVGVLDGVGLQWPVWSTLSTLTLSEAVSIIGWVGLSGAAYLLSWSAYRRTQRPLHRNRLRYWMLIMVFVLVGDGLFVLLGFPYGELGTLLHWFGVALSSIVLLSHHLPDLSGVVRQTLKHVLLTFFTALVFGGGIYVARLAVPFLPGAQAALFGAAGTALVLAILYPLFRRWIQQLLDRLLFGEGYDRERILREYSQGISNILDLERLVTVAVGIISDAMEVQRGALLVCEESPTFRLRPVPGMGILDVEPIAIDRDSSPIAHMLDTRAPLSQYDLDLLPRFQDISSEEHAWFGSLNMEVYVPILATNQLLGILVLGAKASGEPYASADVALLRTLAGQTAVALKNARLVDDLKRLNAEITQLNQDLTETNERLAILDKTKSDFISIASHELKTPLTHIKGYTDMLMEMSEGEAIAPQTVQRITQGISKGTKRLHSVVDAMLDVSLIEQEAFSIHPIPISLRHVVKQVVGGLETAIQERHQAITTAGLDSLPDIIADETRLHQALRNVIINSIKFTPDEGHIEIRARALNGGDKVELAIADNGIGIDPEHQALIFEKFYRVGDLNLHSTGQTKFKGAGPGLGLPIARGIIEAHGGQIWVESRGYDEETCPGSTFYIVLPVQGPLRSDGEAPISVG